MFAHKWVKSSLVIITLLFLSLWAFQLEALARVGGGRSMGSRGSRSFSPPRPYVAPRPSQPTRPSVTPTPRPLTTPTPPPTSQPSSFWRSLGGGILGGLAGGLLFRSLFGGPEAAAGPGAATGRGIGFLDILILAGIGYFIYRYIKRRRQEAVAEGPYQSSAATRPSSYQPPYQQPPYYDQPSEGDLELETGLSHIRQMDPSFDENAFRDQCLDFFFKIQAAWGNRDLDPMRHLLTEEMYRNLSADAAQLIAERKINKLDNIAVRSVDLTEAWQESGQDFITVRIYANLVDYIVDEKSGEVLSGSKTEPITFEEYWTFTRPVGTQSWQLSAINQAS
ncbi:MAG: Tim44 domain-containing protein [Thermodesulfobacteriota bacterium]